MKRTMTVTLFLLLTALPALAQKVATNWERTATAWDSGPYVYDAAGNIVAIGDDVVRKDVYSYDGAGRLVSGTAHTPGYVNEQTFAYDRHGNLKRITTNGVAEDLSPDPATNRLPGVQYDEAGNQLGGADNVTYAWDSHNMMTSRSDVTTHERYVYDANDERIVAVRAGGTRLYTLRGADQKVVREIEHDVAAATWTWKRDYVYRGSTLLASYVAGEPGTLPQRHYHVDHLGTPRVVTSAEGYKLKLHTYWPFGIEAPGSEPDSERLKFTAHERDQQGDPARELDYMHARYYSPKRGRFLSVDPTWESADLGEPQSWNRYSYVENDPVNKTDPDGRNPLGALIGGAIGVSVESYRQVTSGRAVDNRRLLAALTGGAVAGATGGLGGASLRAALGFGAAGGVLGGATERGINKGEKIVDKAIITDAVTGAAGGAAGQRLGQAVVRASQSSGTLNQLAIRGAAQRAEAAAANAGLGADRQTARQAETLVRGITGGGDVAGNVAGEVIKNEINEAKNELEKRGRQQR